MEPDTSQLPKQMPNPLSVLHPAPSVLAPRVGNFSIRGRKSIQTPHYVAITSRGAVSHLSPDVVQNHTNISSLHIGLEDFLEKAQVAVPPILSTPRTGTESRLRKFIAARDDDVLILDTRRAPPLQTPPHNLPSAVAILTSMGVHHLEAEYWLDSIEKLQPDIVIGISDIMHGHTPGAKRRETMVDRTHAYTRDATRRLYEEDEEEGDVATSKPLYFAPILPLENTQQGLYLEDLADELRPAISGLAIYESASLSIVSEELGDLPRMCFSNYKTPQQVLREVSLGADLLAIPFISELSDAGMALDFTFPPPNPQKENEPKSMVQPLALDIWDSSYATSVAPISEGCECYTCQKHHRAYICHLLSAKEMLAWSLLQIHNYHVMDNFFAAIRDSIAKGTFETDSSEFERTYAPAFPPQTGSGPRLRGYSSYISGPGEPKRNAPAYGRLDDLAKLAESQSSVVTPDTNADGLEEHGFAKKLEA
ncbi:queuine tRNA-ribosyltransferase [Talaromyces islandicus]|uniref:Queuine tRNA-ribosyltransferase accessory subunit 2 n=1 Tax=Talaromyces islandicus TaxID=28573 RepID=A0A0U1LVH2_TALIS|nr:queuine tRNA-ribosyltransferase [Talaromyces islandicus]